MFLSAQRARSRSLRLAVALFATLVLAACGGAEGPSPTERSNGYPLGVFLYQLMTRPHDFAGQHTPMAGSVKALQVQYRPTATDQFRRSQLITADGNGQASDQGTISFVQSAGILQVRSWTNDLGRFDALSSDRNQPAPARSMPGANGTLAETRVGDASGSIFESRSLTWSLTAVTSTTAELCLGFNYASQRGGGTNMDCFLVNATGDVLAYKGIARSSIAHVSVNEVYQ